MRWFSQLAWEHLRNHCRHSYTAVIRIPNPAIMGLSEWGQAPRPHHTFWSTKSSLHELMRCHLFWPWAFFRWKLHWEASLLLYSWVQNDTLNYYSEHTEVIHALIVIKSGNIVFANCSPVQNFNHNCSIFWIAIVKHCNISCTYYIASTMQKP